MKPVEPALGEHPLLEIPDVIRSALAAGATIYVSISAGKDSQALINTITQVARLEGWTNAIAALHMDLKRAEWRESLPHADRIAAENGLPLIVTTRPQGDLVAEIEDRMRKLQDTGRPFWPSAAQRYCTADQKRGPADVVYRASAPFWPSAASRYCTAHNKTNQADREYRATAAGVVISAEGIRAQESPTRAKKQCVHLRKQITAKRLRDMDVAQALANRQAGERVAINWYPLFAWDIEMVWQACGTSSADLARRQEMYREGRRRGDRAMMLAALAGWPAHPAYVYGNQRLSCALCVLASENDLLNGARHNPALFLRYLQMEQEGGFTFKNGWSLQSLVPTLLEEGVLREENGGLVAELQPMTLEAL
ncbi:MAG: phosphoadenosine phosphosulfate reductase family protein [Chloroflexi bacterium]|nr:phosphoadenosine phosphosulfate reductase family protein [Chloroflexota bacterium]